MSRGWRASSQTYLPTLLLRNEPQLPLISSSSPTPPPPTPLLPTALQPPGEILTLTHIKHFQRRTPLNNSLDTSPSNAHTASDRQLAKLEKMKTDGSERRVGDGGTAEGEPEGAKVWAAEREDFGCRVGEGAAEGLCVVGAPG